jgi:8-oxo-dGTP pyrophosphatase MutT (NUDIX family)
MGETPEPPLVEREVVRLVVLDSSNRVLLLHVRDLTNPAFGTGWELPGGGMESGETYVEAAIRELREETGIVVAASSIGPASWRRDVLYPYRGMRRFQHERIATVRLGAAAPAIVGPRGVDFEREDLFEARWWTCQEIATSDRLFYPKRLRELLPRFLAGEAIEESLEVWP